eukprot:1385968-Amorphochlora_amoeboformis.AAC.1
MWSGLLHLDYTSCIHANAKPRGDESRSGSVTVGALVCYVDYPLFVFLVGVAFVYEYRVGVGVGCGVWCTTSGTGLGCIA